MLITKITTLTALLSLTLISMAPEKNSAPFKILSLSETASSSQTSRLRPVPDFSLTERSGRKITMADLRGKVWIADFIYTQCNDTCSLQTAKLAKLQEQWHGDPNLRLVSFSVDPAHDTPTALARYAKRFNADARRWLFLTGNKDQIARLIEDGFHQPLAAAQGGQNHKSTILHSPRFILIDRDAQIRASYDSGDRPSVERLKNDVADLLNQQVGARGTSSSAVAKRGQRPFGR
jgi:cytochrome oxidase Cu insertion factor (SCO1/SenC/PrrC family)